MPDENRQDKNRQDSEQTLIAALKANAADGCAHADYGQFLLIRGEFRRARHHLTRALHTLPGTPALYAGLARTALALEGVGAAAGDLRTGLQHFPDDTSLLEQFALLLEQAGQTQAALTFHSRLAALFPDDAQRIQKLGVKLRSAGHLEAAAAAFQRVLTLSPDQAEAESLLAMVRSELGQTDCAVRCHEKLAEAFPDNIAFQSRLGAALVAAKQPQAAITLLTPLVQRHPDHIESARNLAVSQLLTGDFAAGFETYRCRHKGDGHLPDVACWNGEDLTGKALTVIPEQGIGTVLQFSRFLPGLAERAGHVSLRCPDSLIRLLHNQFPGVSLEPLTAPSRALPDYQVPILELGRLLRLDADQIRDGAYLSAEPVKLPQTIGTGPKIGLIWAGSADYEQDRSRSMELANLLPVLERPDAQFYSLQKGGAEQQIAALGFEALITPIGHMLRDFHDTARALMALDALVSVDTAAAHLAGALGVCCHMLLPFSPDWRWRLACRDSPWYASLTLHRQQCANIWDPAVTAAAAALCAQFKAQPNG